MSKKLLLLDADTIIYAPACIIQESPLQVEHKLSKRKKEFKNKTEWKAFLASDKGRGYSEDDFNIVQEPRLKEDISHALHIIKQRVNGFYKLDWVEDIRLFVGGQGNYRKEMYPEYKATRPPKPLAFQDCYDYVLNTFKDKVVVCHGEEAEDQCSICSHISYQAARKLRDQTAMDVVLAAVDKDTLQCEGWHYNYDNPDLGVWWIDDRTAWKAFCTQMFKGDATDDIPGIVQLSAEVKAQYKITTKGVGDATAVKLLEGTATIKEMTQRVVDVYKSSWPENWQQRINMNAVLLRLRKHDGELFNFIDYAEKLGVL